MKPTHILIVDDDPLNSKLVKIYLEREGFTTALVTSGEEVPDVLSQNIFGLIVLDISLPGMDGFETCKKIRQNPRFSQIPIIMLTGFVDMANKLTGFDVGADDYITKPFDSTEFIMRVKALLKRASAAGESQQTLIFRELTLDISRHQVFVNNKEIHLTSTEFRLLQLLVERKGRVQTREKLLKDVWEVGAAITTRTVDEHVAHVRKKLGPLGLAIETIHGYGYRLKEK